MGSEHGGTSLAHAPHSRSYSGRFGRLCGNLPAWIPDGAESTVNRRLLDFAAQHMVEVPGVLPRDLLSDENNIQSAHNSNIPAAYTYFGQFVDHDLTFDPTPISARARDPEGLTNFRTPRLDLDNVYGRGPDDQPYLYKDGRFFRIGNASKSDAPDLPRFVNDAVIGDKRNDENAIVAQIHLAFLLAHNTLVRRALEQQPAGRKSKREAFSAAQLCLQRLYHWIVWNDFLQRITVDSVHSLALQPIDQSGSKHWQLGLEHIYNWKHQPFIPLEFAGAGYRFGHSMVRNGYQTNSQVRGFQNFAALFSRDANLQDPDLRGNRRLHRLNLVQWDWFLPMSSSNGPFPQMARRIDSKLSNALSHLDGGTANNRENILAWRNLRRGIDLGLPSGPRMAEFFGIDPTGVLGADEPEALWYYILKEADVTDGSTLGNLGSSILCAVFAGILKGDSQSYFNSAPGWTPDNDPLLKAGNDNIDSANDPSPRHWQLASIIRLARQEDENILIDGSGSP